MGVEESRACQKIWGALYSAMGSIQKIWVSLYKAPAVRASLLGFAAASVGCAGPASPGTDVAVAYAMPQRSLPGCLAAHPALQLDASRCVPTGPALEYMATGCQNGSYLEAAGADGWRQVFVLGDHIGAIGPVVDGAADIELADGTAGTCDFVDGALVLWP